MHLADRGRRRRDVVECHQPVLPARPVGDRQISGNHPAGDLGRHGRRRVGEAPQRGPVGRRDFLRQRRLEHRHRLPQLRRPAFQLAKGGEHLLSGAGGDLVGTGLGQPASGSAGSMPQRQQSQPAGTPERTGRQDRPLPAPRRCRQWPLLTLMSIGHLDRPPSAVVCLRRFAARRRRRGAPVKPPSTTNTHRRQVVFRGWPSRTCSPCRRPRRAG